MQADSVYPNNLRISNLYSNLCILLNNLLKLYENKIVNNNKKCSRFSNTVFLKIHFTAYGLHKDHLTALE